MKKTASILLLLGAVLGLWGAAHLHERLLNYRARHQLLPSVPLENAPPLMAFTTVALGGFRGLIADLLWLRIARLQKEERVFEIAQLADWITKLAPHFTTVWAFQAWNMAYNISVLFPDAENRWRWINNGIRLLRDEGLRYNPRNPNLYKELGWLYQHKIGYIMDSAHHYYKRKLAEAMQDVRPESLAGSDQARRRRDEFKLDPRLMRQLDEEYGPFDWRLPETHAIYWAWRGRREAAAVAGAGHHDAPPSSAWDGTKACDQMIVQCLSAAFRQGRLDFDPAADRYVTTPNLDLLPRALKAYEEAMARYGERFFGAAYANFLGEAVVILHCYGRDEQAQPVFQQMLSMYPGADRTVGYDDFINTSFARMQQPGSDLPPPDAVAVVEGYLFRAVRRKAAGDSSGAAEYERRAQAFWDVYMQARASEDHLLRTGLPGMQVLYQQAEQRARDESRQGAAPRPTQRSGRANAAVPIRSSGL